MPDFLPIALIALAAGILAVAGILAYRIIWPAREPRTEPVSPAGTTTRPGPLWLRLVPTRRHATATGPAPTAPGDPDETDEPAREDSGADEDWGAELHAMTQELKLLPPVDGHGVNPLNENLCYCGHPKHTCKRYAEVVLADEPANEFDYHAALNALEDAARADIEHIWGRFYDWLGVDPLTRLRLPSAIEQTGEISRVELEAMLEGASA